MQSNQLHLSSVLQRFQSYLANIPTEIWLLSMTYHVFTCRDYRCMDSIWCCKRKAHPKYPWFHSAHSSILSSAPLLSMSNHWRTDAWARLCRCKPRLISSAEVADWWKCRLNAYIHGTFSSDWPESYVQVDERHFASNISNEGISWETSTLTTGPCWPHTFLMEGFFS